MPRPPPKEKKNSFIPKTKLQQSNLKSDGRITGWFKLAPGRPPSDPVLPITLPDSETKQQPAVAPSVKKRNDRSGGYVRWADPENQALLKIALQEDSNSADDLDPLIISRSSLYSIKKRHSEGIELKGQKSLTTAEEREQIAVIIRARDRNNNGMSRTHEIVRMIMDITMAISTDVALNHYKYLMKKRLLPKVTNNTVKVQKTTTKRSQVTIAGQLRWHGLIEDVWKEQLSLNSHIVNFADLHPHFMLNLDETCIMANEGSVRIVGDMDIKKHEKIMDDTRLSITIVRVGSALFGER